MIVKTEDLPRYRHEVAMVDGGFDPIHAGHIEYFREAEELGAPVLCNVSGDHWVGRKHAPLLPEDERVAVIDAIRHVSYTHLSRTATQEVLETLQPRYYVKGKDWEGRLPADEVEICQRLGTQIVFLDTVLGSSTRILNDYLARGTQVRENTREDFARRVWDFEEAVFDQKPVESGHYDDEYFVSDWREGDNKYDVETRRRIEDRNPALIKEVFEPKRVLDMGCGPGMLMYFLHELGVEVEGVDFTPASKDLAPEGIGERIIIGDVTEPHVEDEAYDLVICREVFEHLTVLQVRRTVETICRASSRFVYATTRFHPDPESLLSFTTQFDVDPSHITLLNKEFLRSLFVLEGFRSRPDLEERMDWGNKSRVLVYERRETSQ